MTEFRRLASSSVVLAGLAAAATMTTATVVPRLAADGDDPQTVERPLDEIETEQVLDVVAEELAAAIGEDPGIVEDMAAAVACLSSTWVCVPPQDLPQDEECLFEGDSLVCRPPDDPDETTTTSTSEPDDSGATTTTSTTEPDDPDETTTTSTTEPDETTTTDPEPSETTTTTESESTTTTTLGTRCPPLGTGRDLVDREILEERRDVPDGCWSLVASGDSVTSAHYQRDSGIITQNFPCPGTTALQTGIGNAHRFSYAHRLFTEDRRFEGGAYYNFARTGFTTTQMLTARALAKDYCNNEWGGTIRDPGLRNSTPFELVLRAAGYESAKGRDVAWVTTGGVNNTNWGPALASFFACDLMARVNRSEIGRRLTTFVVKPSGDPPAHTLDGTGTDDQYLRLLFSTGGNCTINVLNPLMPDKPFVGTVMVPRIDIAGPAPTISRDVATMVSGGLQAGIDRIIWVGYYDISQATVDVRGALGTFSVPPAVIDGIGGVLKNLNLGERINFFRDPVNQETVRARIDQLNRDICNGVAAGIASARLLQPNVPGKATCTSRTDAGRFVATDIQSTVPGGSPHPMFDGHRKLARMVERLLLLM